MKNLYVAGVPSLSARNAGEEFKQNIDIENLNQYVEKDVLVWNLDLCRQDAIDEKFLKCMKDHDQSDFFCERDAINIVCFNKMMDLPLKFNFDAGISVKEEYFLEESLSSGFNFSIQELNEANENPVIVNFSRCSAWEDLRANFASNWWSEAKTLDQFEKIEEKFIFGDSCS